MVDFAILAPVPGEHLEDGAAVARDSGYVSFGSNSWDLFCWIEDKRAGEEVPVLIYPSHEGTEGKTTFEIEWYGFYIGYVQSQQEKMHDERNNAHRPPSTNKYREQGDSAMGWGVFWRVRELARLPEERRVAIRDLAAYTAGGTRKNAPPRGPQLVERPAWV